MLWCYSSIDSLFHCFIDAILTSCVYHRSHRFHFPSPSKGFRIGHVLTDIRTPYNGFFLFSVFMFCCHKNNLKDSVFSNFRLIIETEFSGSLRYILAPGCCEVTSFVQSSWAVIANVSIHNLYRSCMFISFLIDIHGARRVAKSCRL